MAGPSLGFTDTNTTGSEDSTATGTSTSTGTSSKSTDTNTSASIADLINSVITGFTNSSTQSNNASTNLSKTTNASSSVTGTTEDMTTSSSKEAIAQATGVYNQAMLASKDTGATDSLVQNILTKAAIEFGGTQAVAKSSGLYNTTSLDLLQSRAEGQAAAESASAVLNYRTTEQQIADAASGNLLNATKTTKGTTTSTTNSTGTTTGDTLIQGLANTFASTANGSTTNTSDNKNISSLVSELVNSLSNSSGANASQTSTDKSSNTAGGSFSLSIICTELMVQRKMSKRDWFDGMNKFTSYPEWGKKGYYLWATPVVAHMQEHPSSLLSKFICKLFTSRQHGNVLANFLVELTSATCGVYLLVVQLLLRQRQGKKAGVGAGNHG